jgi:PEP-CTERM motif-containing protein
MTIKLASGMAALGLSAVSTQARECGVRKYAIPCAFIGTLVMAGSASAATNLIVNGSFEGATGATPTGWSLGGTATDGLEPVTIQYNQVSEYPLGAQGEAVPTDNAASLSPDAPGQNAVYFVSDEAKNLSLFQVVYLTPGSYEIGFDSYDTFNGDQQPHDATLTANIAGVQLANFDLASVTPQVWNAYSGVAKITAAGNYLVSFTFNTPDTPANPDPANPGGEYNAKDVVIDRAYLISDAAGGGVTIPAPVPEPASWMLMVSGFGLVGYLARRRVSGVAALGYSMAHVGAPELVV